MELMKTMLRLEALFLQRNAQTIPKSAAIYSQRHNAYQPEAIPTYSDLSTIQPKVSIFKQLQEGQVSLFRNGCHSYWIHNKTTPDPMKVAVTTHAARRSIAILKSGIITELAAPLLVDVLEAEPVPVGVEEMTPVPAGPAWLMTAWHCDDALGVCF